MSIWSNEVLKDDKVLKSTAEAGSLFHFQALITVSVKIKHIFVKWQPV